MFDCTHLNFLYLYIQKYKYNYTKYMKAKNFIRIINENNLKVFT
jgi:hypothetical protein